MKIKDIKWILAAFISSIFLSLATLHFQMVKEPNMLEILLQQCAETFLIISVIAVLSDKENTVLWENVVQKNLVSPRFTNLTMLTRIAFGILLLSAGAFSLEFIPTVQICLFFLESWVLCYSVFKVLTVYFDRKNIKEEIIHDYRYKYTYNERMDALRKLYLKTIENINKSNYNQVIENSVFLIKEYEILKCTYNVTYNDFAPYGQDYHDDYTAIFVDSFHTLNDVGINKKSSDDVIKPYKFAAADEMLSELFRRLFEENSWIFVDVFKELSNDESGRKKEIEEKLNRNVLGHYIHLFHNKGEIEYNMAINSIMDINPSNTNESSSCMDIVNNRIKNQSFKLVPYLNDEMLIINRNYEINTENKPGFLKTNWLYNRLLFSKVYPKQLATDLQELAVKIDEVIKKQPTYRNDKKDGMDIMDQAIAVPKDLSVFRNRLFELLIKIEEDYINKYKENTITKETYNQITNYIDWMLYMYTNNQILSFWTFLYIKSLIEQKKLYENLVQDEIMEEMAEEDYEEPPVSE